MKEYIGIDLGGTHVRAGLVKEGSSIENLYQEDTDRKNVLCQLAKLVGRLREGRSVSGIGIGVPGVVDQEGRIHCISNLPVLENVMLKKELNRLTGLPVSVVNDCNAAALAEACAGAGKGYTSVYYVTVSTGIGGGFVYRGELMTGASGFVGEVGGMIVDRQQTESFRGLYPGAIEGLSGGDALAERGSRALGRSLAHAGEVFAAARRKEAWAVELTDRMAEDLAILFSGISFTINPDIFVLGGGCMQGADCFLEQMIKRYRKMTPEGLHSTVFAQAQLSEPGLVGAAMAGLTRGR